MDGRTALFYKDGWTTTLFTDGVVLKDGWTDGRRCFHKDGWMDGRRCFIRMGGWTDDVVL